MTDYDVKSEVLKRAKLLDKKMETRKKVIYSAISSALCAAVIIGAAVHFSNSGGFVSPPNDTDFSGMKNGEQTQTTKEQQSEKTNNRPMPDGTQPDNTNDLCRVAINLFKPSAADPGSDSFGEDELAHVNIVLNGSIVYKQIPFEDYPKYGFSTEPYRADFGQYLGSVTETHRGKRKNIFLGADDPVLAGSEVYYYKPAGCRAAVIVQKGIYCSIFVFEDYADQNLIHSIAETYMLFGADAYEKISYLSYTVTDKNNKQSGPYKVSSKEKLKTFYDITASLVPYEITDPKAPTPGWLNDAYDEYRNSPPSSNRETITVEVHFKNGLVMKNISYLPYLTSGYVEGMNPLTPEQNSALRASLSRDRA